MSLIINGMEMPKDGPVLIFVWPDGQVFPHGIYKSDEWDGVKAVPLQEKHGRIVDAAEVLEKANNSAWFDGDVSELGLLLGSEVTAIIPAEGGGEDG